MSSLSRTILNKKGESFDPWGTPFVVRNCFVPICTLVFLKNFKRKASHWGAIIGAKVWSIVFLLTLSNAFLKSKKAKYVVSRLWEPSLIAVVMSLVFDRVDFPFLKPVCHWSAALFGPYCLYLSYKCSSRCLSIYIRIGSSTQMGLIFSIGA